ncbi:MAG TPA: hypothetical protein PK450_12825 [Paracoccaceae bacterium]|nr:hypothetical protein [Paracoccaceae bacterium]
MRGFALTASLSVVLTTPAFALTTPNLTCESADGGKAAFIRPYDEAFALYDYWDMEGEALGAHSINFADCTAGRLVRVVPADDAGRDAAVTILFDTAEAGGRDLDQMAKALGDQGLTAELADVPGGLCVCTADMLAAG